MENSMDDKLIRIVPPDEVRTIFNGSYEDMADLAVIFNHEVVLRQEGDSQVIRWKRNQLMSRFQGDDGGIGFHTPPEWRGAMYNKCFNDGAVDLNSLGVLALSGKVPLEEYMKFYMQIGYSLSGYGEVFGQREVTEYGLEYTSPPPKGFKFNKHYYQTAIEYMREKYAGQVLKL